MPHHVGVQIVKVAALGRLLPDTTGTDRPKADLFRLVQVLGFHQVNSSQVSRVER